MGSAQHPKRDSSQKQRNADAYIDSNDSISADGGASVNETDFNRGVEMTE